MAANHVSTSMFSYTPNQVPIFEGEHFDYWSSQMETLFIAQDLWEVVEDGFPEPDDNEEEEEEWTEAQKDYKKNLRRDASALRFIQQRLSKTIYPRIHGVKRAKEAWNILNEGFHGNDKVTSLKLQSLWREFDNLSKKDNEVMQFYLTRVSEIVNQIRSLGDTIEEKKVVQKVLRSLPAKYDYIVAAIEESKDLSKYTFNDLMSSLQVHEERIGSGKKAEEYLPKEEEVLSKEEENHHEDEEDHFEEEEKEEHKATNQKTMTKIQIVKLEMQIFFAKFAENQIMKRMIASTNARDVEILTTLKEIVITRTKMRRMMQTFPKMKMNSFSLV
ncbi:uncharacterized protein LOC111393019 [Olea europaea var. sylvestris]|uniref:uncharacterized protein LOC111393019 n=1 Tax=Olea europaea var. sylvestris TaxID=158386 RepID=UPI000C1D423D|nr:uncharacterized protein LOC111393019 [Olea europaea var. sylvestris]